MNVKDKCPASTNSVTVSVADRLRGEVRCPHCGRTFRVSHTTKTKILPSHTNRKEQL